MKNPRTTLVVIALLFFAPLLLAVLMRSQWWDFQPRQLSNRGVLVLPPVTLSLEYLRYEPPEARDTTVPWTIIHTMEDNCTEQCQLALVALRQVHIASGRHRDKIRIWIMTPDPVLDETVRTLLEIYPEFVFVNDPDDAAAGAFRSIRHLAPKLDLEPWRGQTFLMDQAGNIILGYPPGYDPHDLDQDLERLLAWSGTN